MKSFDIVGWAFNGAAFCVDCCPSKPEQGPDDDEPQPVFADQASDLTCDGCFDYLIEQEEEELQPPYDWDVKIRYIDPDVSGYDPETVVGDCMLVTFLYQGDEVESIEYSNPQDVLDEVEYWLFNENPED